jgi:GNAT superfamily N-acetyltransferase
LFKNGQFRLTYVRSESNVFFVRMPLYLNITVAGFRKPNHQALETIKPDNTLTIRRMTVHDLPFCSQLVQEAGWNQLDEDWLRAMKLDPEGCFVAEMDGHPVATTTTCRFGNVAWVAMVLVAGRARNQGIGQQIVSHAVQYLEGLGMATIRLDATAFGQGLYTKLGFVPEYELVRFTGICPEQNAFPGMMNRAFPPDEATARIAELDRQVTATQRADYLRMLIEQAPFEHLTNEKGKVIAYAGTRAGRNATQIGPAAASTSVAGAQICHVVSAGLAGNNIYMDIPVVNNDAMRWAATQGFTEQRRFIRMYKGVKINDMPELIWASSGPEKG